MKHVPVAMSVIVSALFSFGYMFWCWVDAVGGINVPQRAPTEFDHVGGVFFAVGRVALTWVVLVYLRSDAKKPEN